MKTACNRCNKKHDDNLDNISCACRTKSYFIGGKRYYNARITKDKMVDGAITMGEYTDIGVMQKNIMKMVLMKFYLWIVSPLYMEEIIFLR